jgi:hypothetical protein
MRDVTAKLARLPPATGTIMCPADDGSKVVILGRYRDSHRAR